MGRSLIDIQRYKTRISGTKLANQANIVSEAGSRAREGLALSQQNKAKNFKIPKSPLLAATLIVAPNTMADGTIQEDTIKKAKAADALRNKRRPAK
tara:strand:+ start:328 stop:615 length:288 start_codon:yes stop_codon:yes gene_type:complete